MYQWFYSLNHNIIALLNENWLNINLLIEHSYHQHKYFSKPRPIYGVQL